MFADKLTKTLRNMEQGIWALPADVFTSAGDYRPVPGAMTPSRKELLSELIADHLGTHDELQSGRTVEVPFITGSFAPLPPDEISVTVWLRKLVRESALQPGAADAARLALDNVGDKQGEAWSAAARRLVILYRAFTVDAEMPHASEEVYFWRYISERQQQDLSLIHI